MKSIPMDVMPHPVQTEPIVHMDVGVKKGHFLVSFWWLSDVSLHQSPWRAWGTQVEGPPLEVQKQQAWGASLGMCICSPSAGEAHTAG